MFRHPQVLFWMMPAAFVGCGGQATHHADMSSGGAAGASAAAGGAGAAGAAAILGRCTLDDDCVAVLNLHTAECLWPSSASKADLKGDQCLMPWLPNPQCTLPPAPTGCVGPADAGNHPCPSTPACVGVHCDAGKCALDLPIACPTPEVPDCETLRLRFVGLLEQGRQCDPSQDPPHCEGNLADTCGCELPYDAQGPHGREIFCAFDAWRSAGCTIVDCQKTCVTPKGPAACVPTGLATSGSCQYPNSP